MKSKFCFGVLLTFLVSMYHCGLIEPEATNGSLKIVLIKKDFKSSLSKTSGNLQSVQVTVKKGSTTVYDNNLQKKPDGGFYGEITNLEPDNDYSVLLYGKNSSGAMTKRGFKDGITVTAGEQAQVSITWNSFVPAQPTPAEGGTISDTTPSLDWNDVSSASAYELMIDNDNSFVSPEIHETNLDSSNYTITRSLTGGSYYWRVRCKDIQGNWGSWSEAWRFTITVFSINIDVSPTSLSFGAVTIGQSQDKTVTISNSSGSTSSLSGNVSISGNGFSIVTGGGSYNLSPGQSKTVTARFSPTANQSYTGSLSITHNGTNTSSPIAVPLSGSGGDKIDIDVSPTSLSFGAVTVGQNQDKTVTISNSSGSTSSLSGNVSISGSGFSIVAGGGAYNLSPGQSKTVTVRFSPTANQSYSGSLSITHNGTNTSSPIDVPLSGSPDAVIISVSPASLSFGAVTIGQSQDKTVTISNSSGSTSSLSGNVSISGSGFSIVAGGGSYNLSPGQSKTLTVRFNPTANQSYSGSLSITHNGTNTSSPIDVPLSGSGTVGIPNLNQMVNFIIDDDNSGGSTGNGDGSINVGETIEFSVEVKNNGNAQASNIKGILSATAISAPYVSITDSIENYPDISPGLSAWNNADFDFEVTGMPPTNKLRFNLTMYYQGPTGTSYSTSISSGNFAVHPGTTTVNDYADRDTYVTAALPNTNYGSAGSLEVGYNSFYQAGHRILIDFDFIDNIPSNATIISAELRLYKYTGLPQTGIPFEVHIGYNQSSWSENSVTWNTKPNIAYISSSSFTIGTNSPIVFDVKRVIEDMVSLGKRDGLIILCKFESGSDKDVWFNSRETTAIPQNEHPYLEIKYTQ